MIAQENKFPGWDILENCWNNNPDGAGFMYQKNGKVIISKGFMTFKELKNSIIKVPNYKTIPVVYHFRIASHGSVSPSNTHPFPYTTNVRYHSRFDMEVPVGIAHNGIIKSGSYDNAERSKYGITDTSQFLIEMYADNMKENNGVGSRPFLLSALEVESGKSSSRFCVMDSKSVTTIGKWYDLKGCKFSNPHSHLKKVDFTYDRKLGWVYAKDL
jgi:predicted glutamine amidotransferase